MRDTDQHENPDSDGTEPRGDKHEARSPEDVSLRRDEFEEPQPPLSEVTFLLSPSTEDEPFRSSIRGDDERSLGIPKRLGAYEIEERIGSGGMSDVYRARHLKLKRHVAIKLMHFNRSGSAEAISRFEREMIAVAKIEHPNVVRAYDGGEEHGTHYLAMELIDGIDTSKWLKRCGRLSVADACEVCRQAALGLQAAHELGLVHRDVKPSNLLLTRKGEVKLLDLGLARLTTDAPTADDLTSTQQIMGTVDYMAPEQALDPRSVDIRADLYSLGCTLYAFLAGQPPFPSSIYTTPWRKLRGHTDDDPEPITRRRSDVPAELAVILNRLMAKNREQRFNTPAEVAQALQPFAARHRLAQWELGESEQAQAATPSTVTIDTAPQSHADSLSGDETASNAPLSQMPQRSRWRAAWIVMALVLVAVGIGVYQRRAIGPEPEVSPSNVANLAPVTPVTEVTPASELPELPAVPQIKTASNSEPDEADLPPLDLGPLDKLDAANIYVVHRETGLPDGVVGVIGDTRWRHWAPVTALAFSPDDKLLASGDSTGLIKVWDVDTKLPVAHLKGHGTEIAALVFSHDGQWLVSASTTAEPVRLWKVNAARSGVRFFDFGGEKTSSALVASPPPKPKNRTPDPSLETPLITQSRALPIRNRLWQLVFNNDDSRLIALENVDDNGHSIVEWDAKHWRETRRFLVKPGSITLAPSGTFAIAGTRAGFASTVPVLWDVSTGEAVAPPATWKAIGSPAAISPDDQFFLTFHDEFHDTCRIWNRQTGELVASPGSIGHEFAAVMNSRHVALINQEGGLHLYAISSGQETAHFPIGTGVLGPRCLALSPTDKFAAVGSESGRVFLVPTDSKGKSPIQQRDLALVSLKDESAITTSAWHVSFSPTQPRMMVASREGDVTEWDLATLRPTGKPISQAAWSTSYSPDGKHVALTANGATQIWDVEKRERSAQWPVGGPGFVTFAQGGQTLVQSNGKRLMAWDVSDHKEVGVVSGVQEAEVSNVAADREGRFVVYGVGNKVKVSNPAKARVVTEYTGHQAPVRFVAISADGKLGASISDDRTVQIWEIETGQQRLVLRGHEAEGWGVSFSPDGKLLVSCAYDGRVIVWDTRAAEPLYGKLHEWRFPGIVHRVSFAPDGRHIATVNNNGTSFLLRVPEWITHSLRRGKVPSTPNERALASATANSPVGWPPSAVASQRGLRASPSASSPHDPTSASTTRGSKTNNSNANDSKTKDKTAEGGHPTSGHPTNSLSPSEWSLRPQALVANPAPLPGVRRWSIETKGHRGIVRAVQYSPDGKWLATAGDDAAIRLWNASTRAFERVLLGHADTIRELRWSPDSQTLATASDDRTIRMWDVATGRVIRVLTGHAGAVGGLSWSHNGELLATRDSVRRLMVWDVKSGFRVSNVEVFDGSTGAIDWLLGDQQLVFGNGYFTYGIWSRATNQIQWIKDVGDFVTVASSPVGDNFAGGFKAGGKLVVLVNSKANKPLRSLEHGGDVTAMAWSRDGKSLATTGHVPNGVKVWDVESGQLLRSMLSRVKEPRDYNARGYSACFSPDGVQLAVGGFDIETEVFEFKGLKTQQHLLYPSRANRIVSSSLTEDGKLLATLTHDGAVRVWSQDGRMLAVATPEKAASVSWVPKTEPRQLAIGFEGRLKYFDFDQTLKPTPPEKATERSQIVTPRLVSWSADGKAFAINSRWESDELFVIARHGNAAAVRIQQLLVNGQQQLSPDGKLLAAVGSTGNYKPDRAALFDALTGELLHELPTGTLPRCVAWSPDGKQLATYSQGKGQIVVWDVATQQTRCLLLPPASAPLPFVAPDHVVKARDGKDDKDGRDNKATSEPTTDGGVRPTGFTAAPAEAAVVTTLHWLPDNQTLLTVSDDRLLRVWNTATGELLRTIESPSSVLFTANGDEFVTATPLGSSRETHNAGPEAGLIRRFNLKTGQPSTTIVPLRDNHWLSLTADGHYQGSPQIDEEIVYVLETAAGQETLSPAEFMKRFSWKN